MPRWSTATTEKSRARVGISIRQAYQVWGQPWTSSSGGPSPPVTVCWRRFPVSTYRLVNVSVNPAGRFGAPDTEPGPPGVGRSAEDELMVIPFPETVRDCAAETLADNPLEASVAADGDPVAADGSDPTLPTPDGHLRIKARQRP